MIDSIDMKLISLLKDNSRLSFADLGRHINLSPSSVRERIQKMEETGVIKKYSIEIDTRKIGCDIEAFILLKIFPYQLKNIFIRIKEFKEIDKAYRILGNDNILLKIVVKDRFSLQKLIDELMNFSDTSTYIILSEF